MKVRFVTKTAREPTMKTSVYIGTRKLFTKTYWVRKGKCLERKYKNYVTFFFSPSKKTIRIGCPIIKHATFYSRKKFHELLRNLKDTSTNCCDIRQFRRTFCCHLLSKLADGRLFFFTVILCTANSITLQNTSVLLESRTSWISVKDSKADKHLPKCASRRVKSRYVLFNIECRSSLRIYVRDRSSLSSWKLPGLHNENWVGCLYVR